MNLTEEKAKEIYSVVPESFKKELEEVFGKETFFPDELDKLSSYEVALELANRPDAKTINEIPEDLHNYILKEYKCIVLNEAANTLLGGQKQMDIYNQNIKRYLPYFLTNGSPSGFRFLDSYCDYSNANAGSGSRLSAISAKAAKHLGTLFTKEFREMLEA
ncbi:hypothetical protein M2132_001788 [Dysgonomonas sp. PH5-45]|uniref:hypothetical protein n=1 Tax=unclassified Dysgonomonas TaxID=2630389 RepID=UPI0024767891|nr:MULTISPECIES: hypothetical protein [unclassified Dysgonomonas]MDH6355445.1 hypothetical protein [Dysgonomonas sp. PH5-45]MDH6388342.1 hypothetical protein [Dysgonomonas sp. PH5-37]